MTEEPCIIQMNIDRYRAMLGIGMAEEQRARVEELLADATARFADAIGRLARAIDQDDESNTAGPMRS
jgi:hypothetical protein